MTGIFSVDLDQLGVTVIRLRRFEQFLQDRLAAVDHRLRSLQESWRGDASTAQRTAHDEWCAGADQLRMAMAALREAVAATHANYCAAVAANQCGWPS